MHSPNFFDIGIAGLAGTYIFLDLTPAGRQEGPQTYSPQDAR